MSSRADQLHQDLLDQVAQLRTSEQWLHAMANAARFHNYSFGNWLLLWSQAERRGTTVTRPAGYRRWQDLGRQVRKGETSYRILAPVTRKVKVEGADSEDTEMRMVGFRVVTVFDVSQTDGEPLPDVGPRLLTGDGDAGLDGAQLVKTTIHELAHVLMHADDGHIDCRGRVEVEAESVAYVVCAAAGLDTSAYSVAYVAGWAERSDDPERTLLSTGERIVSHSRRILDGLERFHLFLRRVSDFPFTSSNLSTTSDMIRVSRG